MGHVKGHLEAAMITDMRQGLCAVSAKPLVRVAEARDLNPGWARTQTALAVPSLPRKGPRPPAPDPIRAGQQGRAGKAPQAVTVWYRTCCAIFVPSRTPVTKLTATRESRWALRGKRTTAAPYR